MISNRKRAKCYVNIQHSATIPNPMKRKNYYDFGSYHECLSQKQTVYCVSTSTEPQNLLPMNDQDLFIKNLFYAYEFDWANHINITRKAEIILALCLPDVCSDSDAEKVFNQLMDDPRRPMLLDRCEKQIQFTGLTRYHIVIVVFLFFTLIILIIAPKMPKSWSFSVFNIKENWRILFNIRKTEETVSCIYGLKVLCLLAVLVGNLQYLAWIPEKKSIPLDDNSNNFTYPFISDPSNSYHYHIDTFFLISGFLSIQSAFARFRGVTAIRVIWARYFRFVTVVVWTIALNFLVFHPLMKKNFAGPLWESFYGARGLTESCQNHWWSDLFLMDHWRFKTNQCTVVSWILGHDLAFFVGSLYFFLPWIELKVVILLMTTLSSLASIAAAGITIKKINHPPTIVTSRLFTPGYFDYFNYFLAMPWIHGTNYLIGCALAAYMKKQRSQLSKGRQALFNCLCFSFFISLSFCEVAWSRVNNINLPLSILYASLTRLVWTLAFSWIIFACHTQKSFSHLNRFLSHKIFMPLSRLNLCLLMTNLVVIRFRNSIRKHPSSENYLEKIWFEWIPDLLWMYLLALIGTLLIEIPFTRMAKRMLGVKESVGIGRILTRPQIYGEFSLGKSTISHQVDKKSPSLPPSNMGSDENGFHSMKF
ncbi:nose resistant to fluoxetine protein 6-like isoform X2 [Brevipalpus obovatus]|uniref:nose resistant to fluoxetine protein 6-like isoform X2 n=1 Tax=Brevipalpus obovatus TaxID=246614 RepID=UPI003D9FA7DA